MPRDTSQKKGADCKNRCERAMLGREIDIFFSMKDMCLGVFFLLFEGRAEGLVARDDEVLEAAFFRRGDEARLFEVGHGPQPPAQGALPPHGPAARAAAPAEPLDQQHWPKKILKKDTHQHPKKMSPPVPDGARTTTEQFEGGESTPTMRERKQRQEGKHAGAGGKTSYR